MSMPVTHTRSFHFVITIFMHAQHADTHKRTANTLRRRRRAHLYRKRITIRPTLNEFLSASHFVQRSMNRFFFLSFFRCCWCCCCVWNYLVWNRLRYITRSLERCMYLCVHRVNWCRQNRFFKWTKWTNRQTKIRRWKEKRTNKTYNRSDSETDFTFRFGSVLTQMKRACLLIVFFLLSFFFFSHLRMTPKYTHSSSQNEAICWFRSIHHSFIHLEWIIGFKRHSDFHAMIDLSIVKFIANISHSSERAGSVALILSINYFIPYYTPAMIKHTQHKHTRT